MSGEPEQTTHNTTRPAASATAASPSTADAPLAVEHDDGQPAAAMPIERERFRSWVTDTARGYTRLTDDQFQRLVLQFEQKPSSEILTALKDAGFHFQADYAGRPNAWVRRNDHTGRVRVDAIEKLLKSQSAGPESTDR